MAKGKIWLAVPVMALVFGLTVVGCPILDGSGGDVANTLVITGVTGSAYAQGSKGVKIGVFPPGTNLSSAQAKTGMVAEADGGDISTSQSGSNYTLTIPLYFPDTRTRWTGSGSFVIYVFLTGESASTYYKTKTPVDITEATTTTISFNDMEETS